MPSLVPSSLMLSVIPSIRITPASPVVFHPSTRLGVEDDGYRAKWLSLPPDAFQSHSSPLRSANRPQGQGLSRDQFNLLLKVSRDQRAKLRSDKVVSQRNLETVERRTRFLSKVSQPPCGATISIPKVPLQSPTIVSCSMSPRPSASEFSLTAEDPHGLAVSPSTNHLLVPRQPLTNSHLLPAMPKTSRRTLPTLDEITTRLKPVQRSCNKDRSQSRLPHFLKTQGLSPGPADNQINTFPVRSLALDEKLNTTFTRQLIRPLLPDSCTLEIEAYTRASCIQC